MSVVHVLMYPRFSSGNTRDGDAAPASVTLSKMPPQSLLAEIKSPLLSSKENNVKSESEISFSCITIEKHSVPSSCKSLRPEEIARMNTSANLLWMSPNQLTTDILDRGDTERVGNDHFSVSMSLSSPPRRSTKSSALNLLQPSSKNNSTWASVS